MKILITGCMILVLMWCSCRKKDPVTPKRSFYMAVTPWPADFTTPAQEDAYSFINSHCDMVSHHFDEGIPYEEAFQNLSWPKQLIADVDLRKQLTAPGKKILLSVAPLNLTRREKADYYRVTDQITDSIKNYWKLLPFNDPKVITSYVNYVSFLIDQLHPQLINYGVESNEAQWDSVQFEQYSNFLSQVNARLKMKYPGVLFFLSFMVSDEPASLSLAKKLLNYTDLIALSAYPYISSNTMAGGNTDPKNLPASFFTNYINLDKNKPWGFAETGYIAQNLSIPSFSLTRIGSLAWQADYLNLVLQLSNERKARFFVWFCSTDYDAGSQRLKQMGLYQDLFGLWQDTGFKDETNTRRPSYYTWLQWMKYTRSD